MDYGAYDFAVLENWTAAHALDDASGGLQEAGISDLDDQSFGGFVLLPVDSDDFAVVFFHSPVIDGGEDGAGPGADLGLKSDGQGLIVSIVAQDPVSGSKDSKICVFADGACGFFVLHKGTAQFPRFPTWPGITSNTVAGMISPCAKAAPPADPHR